VLSPGEAESGGREKQTILADACEAVLAALYIDAGFRVAREVIGRLWLPYLEAPSRQHAGDPKTALQEWAQGEGLAIPRYREVSRQGPDHMPSFTIAVEVEGYPIAEGTGKSKRNGEREAARTFLVRERIWRRKDGGVQRTAQRA
jgi:ribonuclease-3